MVYVVMEMGDTDLSWLIKSISQEKQIPLTMILYYWTEMLTAVKHIHDNGKFIIFNYIYEMVIFYPVSTMRCIFQELYIQI